MPAEWAVDELAAVDSNGAKSHRLRRPHPGWWWMPGSRHGVSGRLYDGHTPGDDQKLKILGHELAELGLVTIPGFQVLCSPTYRQGFSGKEESLTWSNIGGGTQVSAPG